jgi:flotillin
MGSLTVLLPILLGVAVIAAVAAVLVARNLLYVCPPNQILVFSGGIHRIGDRTMGYRYVKGGRAFRVPLLEKVDSLDLTNMIIEVNVQNAYSKGGIPLAVQGVANVKVASHEPRIHNGLERFIGKSRAELERIAKETLEGNLRGVLSQLTPEQVNEDKIAFAEKLLEEAEQDLSRLGLELDTLKVQNVYDEVGYLNSIGRRQSADLIRRSKIAEAQAKAASITKDASNRQSARIAELEAEREIVRAATERRLVDTVTRRDALIAEEVGKVKAAIARAESELNAQIARVEQARRQLQADVVAPAQAAMEAAEADARGAAQKIVEDGKATVAVAEQMVATWQAAGPAARDVFLVQKLDVMLRTLMSTVGDVKVDRVTMLPGGASRARSTVQFVEEMKAALGVDLAAVAERIGARGPASEPAQVVAAPARKG